MQGRDEACEEEEGSKKKWICEYCTYSNWQSSTKCTMCRGKKPVILCSSENIYTAANTNSLRGETLDWRHNLMGIQARLTQLCSYFYFFERGEKNFMVLLQISTS